jgi:hypothetical protein
MFTETVGIPVTLLPANHPRREPPGTAANGLDGFEDGALRLLGWHQHQLAQALVRPSTKHGPVDIADAGRRRFVRVVVGCERSTGNTSAATRHEN